MLSPSLWKTRLPTLSSRLSCEYTVLAREGLALLGEGTRKEHSVGLLAMAFTREGHCVLSLGDLLYEYRCCFGTRVIRAFVGTRGQTYCIEAHQGAKPHCSVKVEFAQMFRIVSHPSVFVGVDNPCTAIREEVTAETTKAGYVVVEE